MENTVLKKTPIELLLDIIRGMQEGVKYKTVEPERGVLWEWVKFFWEEQEKLYKEDKDFAENYRKIYGVSPKEVHEYHDEDKRMGYVLGCIPYEETERILEDEPLMQSLEVAGLGDLIDFLATLKDLNDLEIIVDYAEDECKDGANPSIDANQAIQDRDRLKEHLYETMNGDFIDSITNRLNRLPVGFPAEAILPKRSELKKKPKQKKTRQDQEIERIPAQTLVKELDIKDAEARIKSDVSIYKRENGMLYVRVTIDGKLKRLSLGTRKKSEALWKTMKVLKTALDQKKDKEIPTLSSFSQTYLQYSKKEHRQTTYEKRLSKMRNLTNNLGSMRLDKITKRAIKLYIQKRIQEVETSTVKRELSLLSSVLEYAIDLDLIEDNPAKKVKKPKEPPARDTYLTTDEIKLLLDVCKDQSNRKEVGHNSILYEIVLFTMLTGFRKGNMQKLKWNQVDFKQGNIIIPAGEVKNKKPIYYPLNSFLRSMLLELRERYPYAAYVFSKADGTPYGDWKRSFNTACEKAGLEDFRFHDLRHTHGTLLNILKANEYTITTMMGHRTLAASQRYVHTPPELVKEASTKLGDYLKELIDDN